MYIKEWRHAAWRTSLVREGGRVEQGICVVKEDLLGIFMREGAGGRAFTEQLSSSRCSRGYKTRREKGASVALARSLVRSFAYGGKKFSGNGAVSGLFKTWGVCFLERPPSLRWVQ